MSRAMKVVNWILGTLLLLLVMYGIETSHADEGHGHHHDGDVIDITGGDLIGGDLTGGDLVGGDFSTSGDRAYAVGGSSFDVDINQCLASTATNIIVVGWQTLKENPTCIADGLDARGNHVAAARVRCSSVKTIYNTFPDFEKCVTAVTMTAPVMDLVESHRDRDEDDSHQQEVRQLQQQLVVLIEDQRKAAMQANRYAARQRQDKEDDRIYAQQLIEEIQQIEEPPK